LTGECRRQHGVHSFRLSCGIGKGSAHRPSEFSVMVSVAATISHAKGGQFLSHVKRCLEIL
jgi:IS5 family transposase